MSRCLTSKLNLITRPKFHDSVILLYTLGLMILTDNMNDLIIIVGQCDLYFMVQ